MPKATKQQGGILSKSDAFKLASSAGKAVAALMTGAFQQLALSAIAHANMHGDITIAQRVLEVLSPGMRRNSMVRYFELHGTMVWDKETKALIHTDDNAEALVPECAEGERPTDAQIAECGKAIVILLHDLPWYDAIKENEPQTLLDVNDLVAKLLKRIQNADKAGKTITADSDAAKELVARAGVTLKAKETVPA